VIEIVHQSVLEKNRKTSKTKKYTSPEKQTHISDEEHTSSMVFVTSVVSGI
jgi:hypothetical protein